MKTILRWFAFPLLLGTASCGAQVVLSLDFDERGLPATNTFPGFSSFMISSNTSATAVQTTPTTRSFGGLTVSLAGLGNPAYDDRVRTVPTNNPIAAPGFTQEMIYRDFVFQSSTTNGDGLSITVDGLIADQFYRVTVWSYDNSSTGNRVSDWTANGALVRSAYAFNGSTLPTTDTQYQFNFKIAADSTGRILVLGRRNAATSSAGGVFINAMQFEVTTPDPPTVTSQPVGSTVYVGDNPPTLAVQVSGAAPFTYQWRKDDVDVPNATNSLLTISNAQIADAGGYSCFVTNAGGNTTSTVATLTVLAVVDITSGRISYFPLDAVTGAPPDLTTPDAAPSANHLSLTNLDASNLTAGYRSNAMTFNGTNSLAVRVHTNSTGLPIYGFPAYSVAMWVKGNFTNQNDRRVFSESSNTNNNALVNIGTDNAGTNSTVDIFVRNNDGAAVINHRKSLRPAFDGNWHHIAWVDNNGAARLYVDGMLETTDFNYTRGTLTPNITSLGGILRVSPGNLFAGNVDEVALYRRALSAAEVLTVMNCGPVFPPPSPIINQQPQSRTNFLQTTAEFSVVINSCIPAQFQWCFGPNPLPGETNATFTLASVQLSHAGDYSVKVTNSSGFAVSAAATLTVISNHLPVARDNDVATTDNTPISLSLVKLLANDSDEDGDALSVISISPVSTNGGTVIVTSTNATYTPVNGFVGTDRISYSIADALGATATAHVHITIFSGALPSENQVSLQPLANGSVRIRFAGIPGRSYQVQRAIAVQGPWTTVDTRPAPAHGVIEYVDANPPQPLAFYRTSAL